MVVAGITPAHFIFIHSLPRTKLSTLTGNTGGRTDSARQHYTDYTQAREEMLKATHTDQAPWTLVDFNDQKRGRLTLIRDLLDRLPDLAIKEAPVEWPPLGHDPIHEKYGVVKPIADFPIGKRG